MKKNNKLVSIIIRTKNEERWISSSLDAINQQKYSNFEIIIVDNFSEDKTLNICKKYKIKKIYNIKKYIPGKALNIGISKSKGFYIVCISAHCIPCDKYWLTNLVKAIEENNSFAAAYGRQLPMSFSSNSNKRDLITVFGLDKKIQIKDPFFHNANSIIKTSLLKKYPFNNKVLSIEDRLWAEKILSKNFKIVYTPDAKVFHYHGIHQDGNNERLKNVIDIIEDNKNRKKEILNKKNKKKLNVIALIPIRGKTLYINKKSLLSYTIASAKKSKYIKRIVISSDNRQTINNAIKLGAEAPFIRPKYLSDNFINLETVQKYNLNKITELDYKPDLIVHLEQTFPFRKKGMIDEMINELFKKKYDSIIACKKEHNYIIQKNKGNYFSRIDEGNIPRNFKENPIIFLRGLCLVTFPDTIKNSEDLMGERIGLFNIENPVNSIEVRSNSTMKEIWSLLDKIDF